MSSEYKIISKKYIGNPPNKKNTVDYELNGKPMSVDVVYVASLKQIAFVVDDYIAEKGLGTNEEREKFLDALNKYSKGGRPKKVEK